MKTIRSRIMFGILVSVILATATVGLVSAYLNYSSTLSTLNQTLSQSVNIAANQVSTGLDSYKLLAKEFAESDFLITGQPKDKAKAELERMAATHGFVGVERLDVNGVSWTTGAEKGHFESFTESKNSGEPFISDPTEGDNGDMVIYISAPVMKDGKFDGNITIQADASFLSDIASSIRVGTGNAAILNKNGDTIGFEDMQLVRDRYNTQKEAKSDPALERLAEIESNMCKGITGFGSYYYNGKEKMMAYRPISGTDGWSIDIAVVRDEFMSSTVHGLIFTIVLVILAIILATLYSMALSKSIASPIKSAADRLKLMSEGDLASPVPTATRKDETGLLLGSLQVMKDELQGVIRDMGDHLSAIADGNLTKAVDRDYPGDLRPMSDAMKVILTSLNSTLTMIDRSADQVAAGSEQVSSGAQALSQGATEQASSVEELAATITEISQQVDNNAKNAALANDTASKVGDEMHQSNLQMDEMTKAMGEISGRAGQIGKIIKTIEDIAFQTNILALNAAVEAARAGAAGKGFAVVADEVRNLAIKSSDASKTTAELIEGAIRAVENGTHIADETAKSLVMAVEGAKEVTSIVGEISKASREQAESIGQVTQGIDQISAVVQTNSATAEESAASSEELSSQAQTLKSLVGKFTLRNGNRSINAPLPSAVPQGLPDTADFTFPGAQDF